MASFASTPAAAAATPVFERSTECPGAPTKGVQATSEGAAEPSDDPVANLAGAFERASINDAFETTLLSLTAGVTPDLGLELFCNFTGVARGLAVRDQHHPGHSLIKATVDRIRHTGLNIHVVYTPFADEAEKGFRRMFTASMENVDRYLRTAIAALRHKLGEGCVIKIAFIQSGTTTTQVAYQLPDGSWEYELFETGSSAPNADELIRLANWLNVREVNLVLDCGSSGYTTLPKRVAIDDTDFDQAAKAYPHVAALRQACSTIAGVEVYAVPARMSVDKKNPDPEQPMWTVETSPVVTDVPGQLHFDIGGQGSTRSAQHALPEVKVKFDQRAELFPDQVIDSATEYAKLAAFMAELIPSRVEAVASASA